MTKASIVGSQRRMIRPCARGLVVVVLVLSASACRPSGPTVPPLPWVVLETAAGDITVEIDTVRAPTSGGNFLRYVDEGRYAGAKFYRVVTMDNQPDNDVKIEVIQGGLRELSDSLGLPSITHETTDVTGLIHVDGTLSMARSAPGTASSEIFICVGDQPELDFGGRRNPDGQGFAAFGRVVAGMNVVRAIQAGNTQGQTLTEPVAFTTRRLTR